MRNLERTKIFCYFLAILVLFNSINGINILVNDFLLPSGYAETYAIEKPDGSIVIANYFENSSDSLEEFLVTVGLGGLTAYKIDPSTFPTRQDRKYWIRQGKKIVVDTVQKQEDLDDLESKKQEKEAVFNKLKNNLKDLTFEEFQKINGRK